MIPLASACAEKLMYSTLSFICALNPFRSSIVFRPFSTLCPVVPATQYPGMIIVLSSEWHHFLKSSSDRPAWSIPGVARTTIGPGLSAYRALKELREQNW